MELIRFVLQTESTRNAIKAVGAKFAADGEVDTVPVTGDFVGLEGVDTLALRVVARLFVPPTTFEPARWYLFVETAQSPL